LLPAFALLSLLSVGCVDEKVVFRDRELFEQPPDSINNFLGYFDVAAKTPVCGNCHVGQTAVWRGTAHADAWASIASRPDPTPCQRCHAVSEEGNVVNVAAGINVVRHERYYDVQCESCHGPGLAHVENPDNAVASQAMLAPASVGVDLTTGCGQCHSGSHNPFVEEWSVSPHAGIQTTPAGRAECAGCHRGQAILAAWGENADYIEKDDAAHLPIVCAVCHDPHDARNPGQLRFTVNTVSVEEHLCARCHNRRTIPDSTSSRGLAPHAPEAALVTGEVTEIGWVPPGSLIASADSIRGTHGSAGNPTLCARCHVFAYETEDTITGGAIFTTGHLFRPIPCVDASGRPLPFEDTCGLSTSERSFAACTGSGCHFDATAAFSALTTAVGEIQNLADDLLSQLTQVDPNLDGAGGEIDGAAPPFTVADGSHFNYRLATFGSAEFGTNTVIGSTAHNPFLIRALLFESIQAMQDQYGVSPAGVPANTNWRAKVEALLSSLPE
jgi:predicted CXXCH cytochrome family protein